MEGKTQHADADCLTVAVYDSDLFDSRERFGRFRDACARSWHPLEVECSSQYEFKTRCEAVTLEAGLFSRARYLPLTFHRTRRHVDNSRERYIYGTLVVSGGLALEQRNASLVVKPAELLIADSIMPCTAKCGSAEQLSFAVSESELAFLGRDRKALYDSLPWHGTPAGPLTRLLEFMAKNMSTCSKAELNALFHAATCLLPLATGSLGRIKLEEFDQANPILRKIYTFIDANVSNPALSAYYAALEVGVTDRYVHKLFAARGTTFSAYVTARRLDRVGADLISRPRNSISGIAYRWGFNDISTFNKEFKKRYGCTPSRYRGAAE